jgi:hypothetical protein
LTCKCCFILGNPPGCPSKKIYKNTGFKKFRVHAVHIIYSSIIYTYLYTYIYIHTWCSICLSIWSICIGVLIIHTSLHSRRISSRLLLWRPYFF